MIYKKILLIGDNFIAGGSLAKTKTWSQLIANRNAMTIYNHGLNGASVAYFEDEETNSLVEEITSILASVENADYVVFCAGHFDSVNTLEIGENDDLVTTTFKGALNTIFSAIITKFPKANIIVLSPFNRTGNEEMYVNAMKEIAGIYAIPFFNNYTDLGISMSNPSQKNVYDQSGTLFLNEAGHTRISLKYENILNNL